MDVRYKTNEGRVLNRAEIDATLSDWFGRRDADECESELRRAGIPGSRVFSIADCVADPHYRAREMIAEVDDPLLGPVLHPGICPKFGETKDLTAIKGPGPIGRDNELIFSELLGIEPTELQRLRVEGVV